MTVGEVLAFVDQLAPFETQMDFDNSGLLTGDPAWEVTGVLVALDVTNAAIDEAVAMGANLLLTHHPLMFHPLRRLCETDHEQALLCRLIRHGIALIAAHTNFDLAQGGTNDTLAALLGLRDVLTAPDGLTRVGTLSEPISAEAFATLAEERLGDAVRVMGRRDRMLTRIGLVTGAGGEYWQEAKALGAEGFVSGEIRHHEALAASEAGLTLFECGHHATEEPGIFALADALQKEADRLQWKGCIARSRAGAYPTAR